MVARAAPEQRVRAQLADLAVPLANLFPAPKQGSGLVPQFGTRQVGDVSAHQLQLAPGLAVTYAVFDHLLVVSTSLQGIAAVAHHARSLANEPEYAQALPGQPRPVTTLVFLDFSRLLSLAERTGLAQGTRDQPLRPDLGRIGAVGIQTTRGPSDSTAQITFQIR